MWEAVLWLFALHKGVIPCLSPKLPSNAPVDPLPTTFSTYKKSYVQIFVYSYGWRLNLAYFPTFRMGSPAAWRTRACSILPGTPGRFPSYNSQFTRFVTPCLAMILQSGRICAFTTHTNKHTAVPMSPANQGRDHLCNTPLEVACRLPLSPTQGIVSKIVSAFAIFCTSFAGDVCC